MADNLSRIESQLTDEEYSGPYLSRIEMILKDLVPGGGAIGFKGPYDSVAELPDPGEEGYIYLVTTEDQTDYYDEYYWSAEHESYTPMGTTKLELESYAKKEDVEEALEDATTATYNSATENVVLGG